MPFYINTQNPDSSREIAHLLEKCIKRHKRDLDGNRISVYWK